MTQAAVAKKKYTYQDYLKTPDDQRYELIEGELSMTPAPKIGHQRISIKLASRMTLYAEEKGLGEVLDAPCDVYLDEETVVQPDILFISKENQGIIDYKDGILGAPDLIVEVISPGSFAIDRFDKKRAYEKAGVREYWLVDPNNLSVEIYKNGGQQFELAQVASEAGKVQSTILEGFEVDIQSLFIAA